MVPDVEAKIDIDFSAEQRDAATSILHQLDVDLGGNAARILRCVLFLASDDLDRLQLFSDESRRDWRDVIVWAELGDAPSVYRDFRKPFPARAPGADV
jgi:hypothetical protein